MTNIEATDLPSPSTIVCLTLTFQKSHPVIMITHILLGLMLFGKFLNNYV